MMESEQSVRMQTPPQAPADYSGAIVWAILAVVIIVLVVLLGLYLGGVFDKHHHRHHDRDRDPVPLPAPRERRGDAPRNLEYADTNWHFTYQSPIGKRLAEVSGSFPLKFTTCPALPLGLSIDRETGAITGTPLLPSKTDWVGKVRVSNCYGRCYKSLTIKVEDALPNFYYSNFMQDAGSLVSGTLAALTPVLRTSPASVQPYSSTWYVGPALLNNLGLILDPASGIITGTVLGSGPTTYPVTVTNFTGGVQTISLYLEGVGVSGSATGATFATTTLSVGVSTIDALSFTATFALSFSYIGPLPDGMEFESGTGNLIGTPTVVAVFPVTVTYTTSAGSIGPTVINFTVVEVAPTFYYPLYPARPLDSTPLDHFVAEVGVNIEPQEPRYTAGSLAGHNFLSTPPAPPLPIGLDIQATSISGPFPNHPGTIFGSPDVASILTSHTITDANGTLPDGTTSFTTTVFENRRMCGELVGYSRRAIPSLVYIISHASIFNLSEHKTERLLRRGLECCDDDGQSRCKLLFDVLPSVLTDAFNLINADVAATVGGGQLHVRERFLPPKIHYEWLTGANTATNTTAPVVAANGGTPTYYTLSNWSAKDPRLSVHPYTGVVTYTASLVAGTVRKSVFIHARNNGGTRRFRVHISLI